MFFRVEVRPMIAEEVCLCGTVCSSDYNRIGDLGAQALAGALVMCPS